MKNDYFSHAYGEDYKTVIELFDRLGAAVDFRYFVGSASKDIKMGKFYDPDMSANLRKIPAIIDEYADFIEAHKNMPYRAQTVSYRLLAKYLDFTKRLAPILALKAEDKEQEALEQYKEFVNYVGKYELEMERCIDHHAFTMSLNRIFLNVRKLYDA